MRRCWGGELRPRVESDDGGVEVGNFVLADCQIPIKDF